MRKQFKKLVLSGAVMFALIATLGVSTASAKPLEGAALGVSKASAVMFNPKEYTTPTPTLTARKNDLSVGTKQQHDENGRKGSNEAAA